MYEFRKRPRHMSPGVVVHMGVAPLYFGTDLMRMIQISDGISRGARAAAYARGGEQKK
jgi:hypothetical protein